MQQTYHFEYGNGSRGKVMYIDDFCRNVNPFATLWRRAYARKL